MEYAIISLGALVMCILAVEGCTDFNLNIPTRIKHHNETDEQKVYYSEHVAFGTVLKDATGDYPFKGVAGVRTVEFKVACTYKGGKLPKRIFIAGVGNLHGEIKGCPPVNVTKNDNVLMFLKKTPQRNVFEVEYKPNSGSMEVFMDDISLICGLTLVNSGRDDELEESCSDPIGEEDCINYVLPTPAPVTMKPKGKTTPKVVIKIDDDDDLPATTPKVVIKIEDDDDLSAEEEPTPEDEGYVTKPNKPGKTGGVQDDSKGSACSASISVLLLVISALAMVLV